MKLRKLRPADAPQMLEWMHDTDVVAHLGTNFADKTLDDCLRFIASSQSDPENLHLAIANEADEYMGTVSLKHIDLAEGTAEFAITIRRCAMGCGYSQFGMREILNHGIGMMHLSAIYWCVSAENKRAVRFYDKSGYCRTHTVPDAIRACYSPAQQETLLWYVATAPV